MNETDNREIEIDLLELLTEFKKNIVVIVGMTLLFAAAAALYVFVFTAPKYSYTQLVNCPSLSDRDKINFVSIFNKDAGSKIWNEPQKCTLSKVEFVREKNAATNLLKFEFQGTDPDLLKKEGRAYTEDSLSKINERIVELHEIKYGKEYFDSVRWEMWQINNSLQNGSVSAQGASQYLLTLKERLEAKERNKMLSLIKADLVPNRVDEAVEISRKKYILISGFLGLFLSLAFLAIRYCRKTIKKK